MPPSRRGYRVKVGGIEEQLADVLVVRCRVFEQGQIVVLALLLQLAENGDGKFRRMLDAEAEVIFGVATRATLNDAPAPRDVVQRRRQVGRLQERVV